MIRGFKITSLNRVDKRSCKEARETVLDLERKNGHGELMSITQQILYQKLQLKMGGAILPGESLPSAKASLLPYG